MSQHDGNIANQNFPNFRADLNNALAAIFSNSSGTTEPDPSSAYQFWYDTTNDLLKMRNSSNDAWITLAYFDQLTDEWEVRSAVIQAVDSAGFVIKTDDGTTRVTVADNGNVTLANDLTVTEDLTVTGNLVAAGLNYPTSDGTSGQVIQTDGSGNLTFATPAGGGGGFESIQVFTSSGTWTKPSGISKVKVYVIGGGGGGGGADCSDSNAGAGGGGGGAGGCAIEVIDVSAVSTVSVTIGTGGAGGANNGGDGSTGGSSSFGAYCSATGGAGGIGYRTSNNAASPGGSGGVGSGGDLNLTGQGGSLGVGFDAGNIAGGGTGAGSFFNGGPTGPYQEGAGQTAGTAGTLGAGGSGGVSVDTTTGAEGGSGGAGIVVVEEYA